MARTRTTVQKAGRNDRQEAARNSTKRAGDADTREIPDALKHFDSLPDSANVRQPVVEGLYGYSSATLWRRVKDGRLPCPRKLSDRVTVWNVGELRRALNRGGEAA